MHELSLARNIMTIIGEHLPEGREAELRSVRVRVGPLAGVSPESLRFCFDALASGTPLAGATLEIDLANGAELEVVSMELADPGTAPS
jgi:hydrogenase nickel incorporation protein HypA/HybF